MAEDSVAERERQYWEGKREFEWLAEESIQEVIRSVPTQGDILELCSGSGMFTKRMPTSWSSYTCLDLSQSLLDTLREAQPGIMTVRGDAQSPGLRDESFDTVLVFAGLHHLPDPNMAISGAWRMLRRGGVFVCFEPNQGCWYRRPMPALRKWLGVHTEDERFLRPGHILAALERAGFHNLDASFLTPAYNPDRLQRLPIRVLVALMRMASRMSVSPAWQSFFIARGQKR